MFSREMLERRKSSHETKNEYFPNQIILAISHVSWLIYEFNIKPISKNMYYLTSKSDNSFVSNILLKYFTIIFKKQKVYLL